MVRLKPNKVEGIRIGGVILETKKDWFTFEFRTKNQSFKDKLRELRPRVQKVENGKYKFFGQTFSGVHVNLVYLNWESAEGRYKNPENNLPYQIFSQNGIRIYQQDTKETKENIFNRLEKTAIEEGLRNPNNK